MKAFEKSKFLLGGVLACTLTACGGSSDKKDAPVNQAPTYSGDINVTVNENDAKQFFFVDLLQGAIDKDGDVLLVRDLKASLQDTTGFENQQIRIGVDLSKLAPLLDTGTSRTMTYTYNITDGKDSVSRTASITVVGQDTAPKFDNLIKGYTKYDTAQTIDLTEAAVDDDGEPLTIGDFAAAANNPNAAFVLDGNKLTLDIPSFGSAIELGGAFNFTFSYNVKDHNHSIPRTLTVAVRGVKSEPLAPEIQKTFSAAFDTNSAVQSVDLASSEYIVEWNGDPINIDWASITPTNGGPALKFSKSTGTTLVIDPADFTTHMALGTQVFNYSLNVNDGTGSTGGFVVPTSFDLTVTKVAAQNLVTNGDFATNLAGWSVLDSALGKAVGGKYVATGTNTLSQSFNVTKDASYFVKVTDWLGEWGAYNINVKNGESLVVGARPAVHPPFSAANAQLPWGPSPRMNTAAFTATASGARTLEFATGGVSLDDISVNRFSTDNANNIVYQKNATDFDFENGQGDWVSSGTVEITTKPTEVISGKQSLKLTPGWGVATLDLPTGSIQNGKKYLLSMAMHVLTPGTDFLPMGLQINDATDATITALGEYYSVGQPRSRMFFQSDATAGVSSQVFQHYIDVDAYDTAGNWSTRTPQIRFLPNIWNATAVIIIDNVRLVEVQ